MVNWGRRDFFTGFSLRMIYFDNNATTQIAPEARAAMAASFDAGFGNPSSAHAAGREARAIVDGARRAVAKMLGASSPNEIVFTSGGTESDNWAILGAIRSDPKKNHIITTSVEHEAIRKLCETLAHENYEMTMLEVDENGELDLEQLCDSLTEKTAVVSIMLANNETGVLFPVAEAAEIVKQHSKALFHTDGVNAAGKVPTDLHGTEIDLCSISAHKFHGPKGIGALYIREGVSLPAIHIGGGQELGRRAGTEAVHQLAGLGAAAQIVSDLASMDRVRGLRDRLESELLKRVPNSRVNGSTDPAKRLPNTSNISFENTNGEMIVSRLDDLGVCVSTGSACHSADRSASRVLQAMNVPYSYAMGSIRFSLGRYNMDDEVNFVIENLPRIVADIKRIGI
jgi:cysteine desulfurase